MTSYLYNRHLQLSKSIASCANKTQTGSIISATSTIAHDLMSYYTGIPLGVLPRPYYWWEAGAMWGSMISYWHYTNDSIYVEEVGEALLSQSGPANNFLMPDQVYDTGNDDQAFWALTAMSAVEYDFPIPSSDLIIPA